MAQRVLEDGIYKSIMDGVIAGSTTLGSDLDQLAKLRNGNLTDAEKTGKFLYPTRPRDPMERYYEYH